MSGRLPEFIDPWRLADQGRRITGQIELVKLSRLAAVLLDTAGTAEFDLLFDRDSRRRATIKGYVRSSLKLECQRCLDRLELPVDARVSLAVIEVAAEAERLPEEYDPVLIEDSRFRLLDLVEDELLLAIPQTPRHVSEQCGIKIEATDSVASDQDPEDEHATPFAALAGLQSEKPN